MAIVVSLRNFEPPPRYDGIPWTHARIEEGPTHDGPWTQLADMTLTPVDADPRYPMTRSWTIENATIDSGWYKVTFLDATNDKIQPVEPIQNLPDITVPYTPTLNEVGVVAAARTKDQYGNETLTFTSNTRPTGEQVRNLIEVARDDVVSELDEDIPAEAADIVRAAVALRTAMLIETSYFPERIGPNTNFSAIKDLYDDSLRRAQKAVVREAEDEAMGERSAAQVITGQDVLAPAWDRAVI